MTYPQPSGADSVAAFENVYRLNTQISSPGDIYELDVSAAAFLIGPDSDIAQVRVTMFDPTEPVTRSAKVIVTPDRSFVAPSQARIDTIYPLSGQKKGRILFSPNDIVDSAYTPVGFVADDRISIIAPRLDVMAYYSIPPSLVAQRSDRRWNFQFAQPPVHIGDDSWVVVPYWGRKYAHIDIANQNADAITVEVRGVNFTTVFGSAQEETILSASAAVAPAASRRVIVRASVDGMYDMLAIKYQTSSAPQLVSFGPFPTRIMTSDDPL